MGSADREMGGGKKRVEGLGSKLPERGKVEKNNKLQLQWDSPGPSCFTLQASVSSNAFPHLIVID